ncbi:hypothetical protein SAMCCGM7_pC1992 (plasmid) [Sinorhizobium americanum CCGM7]|nr:hypothetical protein SAMCCGM7_pC1992 [Sinorhizobium americanum CCGM7]
MVVPLKTDPEFLPRIDPAKGSFDVLILDRALAAPPAA